MALSSRLDAFAAVFYARHPSRRHDPWFFVPCPYRAYLPYSGEAACALPSAAKGRRQVVSVEPALRALVAQRSVFHIPHSPRFQGQPLHQLIRRWPLRTSRLRLFRRLVPPQFQPLPQSRCQFQLPTLLLPHQTLQRLQPPLQVRQLPLPPRGRLDLCTAGGCCRCSCTCSAIGGC
jgi:hypothetical protein